MKTALSSEVNPLDARLENVLPGVNQWHRANHEAVTTLAKQVSELDGRMIQGMQEVHDAVMSHREESDRRLAETFLDIARQLLSGQSPSASLPGSVPRETLASPTGTSTEENAMVVAAETSPPATVATEEQIDPAELCPMLDTCVQLE